MSINVLCVFKNYTHWLRHCATVAQYSIETGIKINIELALHIFVCIVTV